MKAGFFAVPVAASLFLSGCVVATSSSDGRGGGSFLFLLVPAFFVFTMFRLMRGARRRRSPSQPRPRDAAVSTTADTTMIRAELSVLADDALRLEPEVALHDAARNDYESAVHRYRVAQSAVEQHAAGAQIDLTRVQRVVDEAMWSMSRAKAIAQGYPPPPPPPQLQNPGRAGEPAIRLADDQRPTYVGAPVSFRTGWFGGGGGLLGGLMLGSMMGGFGGWVVDQSDDDGDGGNGDPDGA